MTIKHLAFASLMASVCFAAEGAGSGGLGGSIKSALSKLDPNEDSDWTSGGLPSMPRMKELTGKSDLTRDEVASAAPGFARANAASAPSDLSNVGGGNEGAPSKQEERDNAPDEGEPGEPVGNASDVKEQYRTPAQISQDNADDQLPPGEAAVNQTSSFYPEITAGGGGQPGEDDGPLIAEGEDKSRYPSAGEIAGHCPDAILLFEAAVAAASGDKYRRNNPLQNLIRHYQVEQDAIKTVQGRLDVRDADRKKAQEEANRVEDGRADKR